MKEVFSDIYVSLSLKRESEKSTLLSIHGAEEWEAPSHPLSQPYSRKEFLNHFSWTSAFLNAVYTAVRISKQACLICNHLLTSEPCILYTIQNYGIHSNQLQSPLSRDRCPCPLTALQGAGFLLGSPLKWEAEHGAFHSAPQVEQGTGDYVSTTD